MSRPVRFRAWDKVVSVIIDVVEMHFGTNGIDIVVFDGDNMAYSRKPSQYILMQYTGLKDKNGVEIYEGDIILVPSGWSADYMEPEKKRVVEWVAEAHEESGFWVSMPDGVCWNHCEIIGNLHQHPELLEE